MELIYKIIISYVILVIEKMNLKCNNLKLYKKISIFFLLGVLLCFVLASAYSRDDSSSPESRNKERETVNLLPDDVQKDESNITTKIYKSTDQSAKYLNDNLNIEATLEDDVLPKEYLIDGKVLPRQNSKQPNLKNLKPPIRKRQLIMPLFFVLIFVVLLALIFKLLQKMKI